MHLYRLESVRPFPAYLGEKERFVGNDLATYEKAVDMILEHLSMRAARLRLMVDDGRNIGRATLKIVAPNDETIEVVFDKYPTRPHRIKHFFLESEPETKFDGTFSGLKNAISVWGSKNVPELPTLVVVFEPRSPKSRPLWASVNLRETIEIGFIHHVGSRRH
jgi:hypothetical protein